MIQRVRDLLERGNLLYKIIALILAILLWSSVTKPFDGLF